MIWGWEQQPTQGHGLQLPQVSVAALRHAAANMRHHLPPQRPALQAYLNAAESSPLQLQWLTGASHHQAGAVLMHIHVSDSLQSGQMAAHRSL